MRHKSKGRGRGSGPELQFCNAAAAIPVAWELLYASMAVFGYRLYLAASSSWDCDFSVVISSAKRRRRIRSGGLDPGGNNHEKYWQLWEDLFSNPGEWWDNRLTKRSPRHPDFRHKKTREPLWLNNPQKPIWVDFRLVSLDAGLKIATRLQDLCEKGLLEKALDALMEMDQQAMVPSVCLYISLLKACTKRKALTHAKTVHAHLVQHGLELSSCLGEFVVNTLVTCGAFEDALHVFRRLPSRTVVSWTAVISAYGRAGLGWEALRMYHSMKEDGLHPNKQTFISLLKACRSILDLEGGKGIHADVKMYSCESDVFVATCLIDMYFQCGSIEDADKVFGGLSHRDVVAWNTMLAGYTQQGQPEKAFQLYKQMQEARVVAIDRTFVSILRACGMLAEEEQAVVVDGRLTKVKSLQKGRGIHAEAWRKGYKSDVFVGNSLVSMYGRCGSIEEARAVFDGLSRRDVVSWNAMLAAYAQQGQAEGTLQLYEQMVKEGVGATDRTFVSVLQACGMLADKEDVQSAKEKFLEKGREIHVTAWRQGYDSDIFIGCTLVNMYSKCGSIIEAQKVFDVLSQRNVVLWNAMLAAYAEQGQAKQTLDLYGLMLKEGVPPDVWTFVTTLQACGMLAEKEEVVTVDGQTSKKTALKMGMAIHADAWSQGYQSNVYVSNALVSMYGKCGSIEEAQNVFDGLSQRDVVSWNGMLATYAQQGYLKKALLLYEQMLEDIVSPDDCTFVSVLQVCGMLAEKDDGGFFNGQPIRVLCLEKGKAIHADARRKGYESDVILGNTLISMYGKCGSIVDAQNVFDELPLRTVVTWNALIAAYAQQAQEEKALQLYGQMQDEGVGPSEVTFLCIVQACSNAGNLDKCMQIHRDILCHGKDLSRLLANTLIYAYGRCASMINAKGVFDALPQPDVVSWTTLIAGYAREGSCLKSLQTYDEMQQAGVKPDGVTFLSLLSSCSHAGLVGQGVKYFESMSRDHGITPHIEHYVCMVDLLGRAGYFASVQELLSRMPMKPNLPIWLCLLSACRKYDKVVLGKEAFNHIVHIQPKISAAYVLMSSIYAQASMWDCVQEVNELRQRVGAWKVSGLSRISFQQEVHNFMVADCDHPDRKQLYELLGHLEASMWRTRFNQEPNGEYLNL